MARVGATNNSEKDEKGCIVLYAMYTDTMLHHVMPREQADNSSSLNFLRFGFGEAHKFDKLNHIFALFCFHGRMLSE